MPTTYVQRSTASDLSSGGQYNFELLETTAAEVAEVISLSPNTTVEGYHYTDAGVPGADGTSGDFSVEVDIAVGDTNVMVSAAVARVNSSGTVQNQSSFTGEQTADGTVLLFNFINPNLGTWATGDRLRVAVRYRNSHAHASRDVSVGFNTADSEVVAPWSAAAPVDNITGTATTDVAASGTLSVPAGAVPNVTGTATTDVAASGTLVVPTATVPTVTGTATTDVAASGTLSVPSTGGAEATVVQGAATTTAEATFPATPTSGNLLVMFYGARDSGSTGVPVFTLPAGWTKVGEASPMEFHTFGIAWRVSDGSALGTQSVSYSTGTNAKWTGLVEFNLEGVSDWSLDASSFDGSGSTDVASIASGSTGTLSSSSGVAVVGGTSRTNNEDLSTDTGTSLSGTDTDFEADAGAANFIAAWLNLAATTALDATISEANGSSRMGAGIAVFVDADGGVTVPTVTGTATTDVAASGTLSVPTATVDSVTGTATTDVAVSGTLSVPAATVDTITGTATTDVAISGTLSVPVATVPTVTGTATTDIAASGTLAVPTATVDAISGTATTDVAVSGVLSVPAATVAALTGTATTDIAASGTLSVPTPTVPTVSGTATTDVAASGTLLAPTGIPTISGTATTDIAVTGTLSVPTATVDAVTGTATTNVAVSGTLSVPTATVPALTGTAATDVAVSGTLSVPTATVDTVSGTATTDVAVSGTLAVPTATVDAVTGTATTDVAISGTLFVPTATVPTVTGTASTDIAASGTLSVPTATVPTVTGTATTDVAVSGTLSVPTDIPDIAGTAATDVAVTGTLSVPTATIPTVSGTATTDVAVSGTLSVPTSIPTITGTATTDVAVSGTLSVPAATVENITGTTTIDVAVSGTLSVPVATVPAITGTATTDIALSGTLDAPIATVDTITGTATTDVAVSGTLSAPTPGVPAITGTATTDIAASGTLSAPTATIPTVTGTATTDIAVSGTLAVPASTVASISGTATTDVAASGALSVPTATVPTVTGVTTITIGISGSLLDPAISLETATPIERYAMLNNALFYTDLIELIDDPASADPDAPDDLVYAEIGNDGKPQGVYRPTFEGYEHFNGQVLFESTESPQTSTLGMYVHIDTRDSVDLLNWGTVKIRQNGQSLVCYNNDEELVSINVENGPLLLAVSITATDVTVQTPIYIQTVDHVVADVGAGFLVGGTEYGRGRIHDVVAFGTAFDNATVLEFFDAALGRETLQEPVGSLALTAAETSVTNVVWSNH